MNILFTHNSQEAMLGLATAFMALPDINIKLWSSLHKPIFDAMEELRPEYFFIHQREITEEIVEAIQTYKLKIVFFGIAIPDNIKEFVVLLIIPNDISKIALKNLPEDVPTYQLMLAGNLSQYRKGFYEERLSSDVFYLSNYNIPTSCINILSNILPKMPLGFKICGENRIATPQYLGTVNLNDAIQLIRSTKVLIDFNHHMIFNGALLKTFVLSPYPNAYFPHFTTNDTFEELVQKMVYEEKLTKKLVKDAYKLLINQDTYFHRLKDVGELLGVEKWTTDSMDALKRLRE